MQIKQFKGKTKTDLEKMLVEARAKLRDLKFQLASSQLKQVHQVKQTKRLISQLKTALTQIEKTPEVVKEESK
jgi:ribosomal protein L29